MKWRLPDPYEVGLEGIKAAIDEQIKRTLNLQNTEFTQLCARKLEFFIPKRIRLKAIIRCQDALALHCSITTFELDEEELEVLGDIEQKRLDALIELRESFEEQMREKEEQCNGY